MSEKVSTSDVVAFRLAGHHLGERLAEDCLLDAAGSCGIQDSPPGSALLALHARVEGVTQVRVNDTIGDAKDLVRTWCMRGAPFLVLTADLPVFTTGALPTTEDAMQHLILGVGPAVEKLDLSLTNVVELTGEAIRDVLPGRRLAIDELGAAVAERIAGRLTGKRQVIWRSEGPHAAGQPLGEAVVHFCIRILTLQQVVCFAPRTGNKAPFVLIDEWLGDRVNSLDAEVARAELLRRYLRSYGPAKRAGFAAWLGVRARDTAPWWDLLDDELTPTDFGGTSWILTKDLDILGSLPSPTGVRLLPPRDPYTQMHDRDTIVAKQHHTAVWKSVGEPGTILVDGKITGIWRPQKRDLKLMIAITSFESLRARDKKRLQAEAEQIASLRGASSVDITFEN